MYERFYSLRERPFSLTPDPDYLYLSRVHREALDHLRYGIESRAGFVVITGEIGCGKTTLLQAVLRNLDSRTSVSRLVHTMLDPREVIESVMLDFGLEPAPERSKPQLIRELARYLVEQRTAGRFVLLVIDEAQNLGEPALDEIRMLSNLETEKSKLIQVVLAGQPQLRDLLARPSLEQLRQRVTVHYHLRPMGPDETAAYINHRLRRASIGPPLMFSADVTDLIYRYSLGVARKVNIMADAMLLFGYGANRRVIDLPHAQEVLRELGCDGECPAPVVAASEPQAGACTLPLRQARQVAAARPASSEELAVIPSRREADDGPEYESRFEVLEPGASNVLGLFQPCYRVLEDPARTTTFWARMRRGFMGVPVFED